MKRIFALATALFANVIICGTAFAAQSALVLHDGMTETFANTLVNLLGHFREYDARTASLDQADPGDIISAGAVFILLSYDSPVPGEDIRNALEKRSGITVFAGEHRWLGALPSQYECDLVTYRGKSFWLDDFSIKKMSKTFGKTFVAMSQSSEAVPFIEREGNRWMIHGAPMFEVPAWILADVLHDILEAPHSPKRLAMVRLEDINPSYSGERLKRLKDSIDFLYSEGVPFSMAVFPVFINAKGAPRALLLIDNPPLLDVLIKAERMGGTVIMHGTSHQYHQVSGEGSEFWDVDADDFIPEEKAYFHERMRYGLWLFKEAGLHPKLFEAPHYNMPLSLQRELTQYFGTIAGSLMISDESYTISQDFPYIIYKSREGLTVLPEQLGYIATDAEKMSIITILERLDTLTSIVRDPFACFFYHPYVAGDLYLRELIPQIRDRGFEFAGAKDYGGDPLVEVVEVPPIWQLAFTKVPLTRFIPLFVGVSGAIVLGAIYFRQTRRKKREMFRE
ncbi:MAG: DUF2334 domain-containing protein [Thermovirgaceae bacterium]|nr:DUF2334 domain-containing protein [Thermovirgaceae bacterium]